MPALNIISINGVQLPTPISYSVDYNDIDASSTNRSETGMLHRTRVRNKMAKIKLEWKHLTTEQVDLILTAIDPASFTVTYYFGVQKTATMYAGSPSLDLVRVQDQPLWDIKFNLIEY